MNGGAVSPPPSPHAVTGGLKRVHWGCRAKITPRDVDSSSERHPQQSGFQNKVADSASDGGAEETKCDAFGRSCDGPPARPKPVLSVRVDRGGAAAAEASPVACAHAMRPTAAEDATTSVGRHHAGAEDRSAWSAEMIEQKRLEGLRRVKSAPAMRNRQAPKRVNSILNLTVGGRAPGRGRGRHADGERGRRPFQVDVLAGDG